MMATDAGFEERGDTEFLFDFDQFERMEEAGIFSAVQGHVELIEGRILRMAPIPFDHGEIAGDIFAVLKSASKTAGVAARYRFAIQVTLKIGEHSAPEPDVLVVKAFQGRKYSEVTDTALVVEVSISTRDNDLAIKAPLYARAGVPELWLVEPESRRIRVLRDPQPDGIWGSTVTLQGNAAVSPLFAPQISIPLSDLLP